VERELTGRGSEPSELIYFKVYQNQAPVIEQAIDTSALLPQRLNCAMFPKARSLANVLKSPRLAVLMFVMYCNGSWRT